jgi:hypothetical protein
MNALPDGDRVALAGVVRDLGQSGLVGGAAREQRGAADEQQEPDRAGPARLGGCTVL